VFISLVVPPDPDAPGGGEPAIWFVVRNGELLVEVVDDASLAIPSARPELEVDEPHFLGLLDGRPVWTAGVHADTALADEVQRFEHLRSMFGKVPEPMWGLAGRAVQIVEWDRTHRFCGRCGEPTELATPERARRCPRCGLLVFPRLAPATITLVERGDQALLAWGVQFPIRMFSCLAGFVEPGETLEECVRREVRAVVCVELDEVRYFGSQPWPFPHQVMIGFEATWGSGEISIDPVEIKEAGWFSLDDLPPHPPSGMSIAGSLIESWKVRAAGRRR
jgi:NAD+ diphosphatase